MTIEEAKKRVRDIRLELWEMLSKLESNDYENDYELDQLFRVIENGINNLKI